MLGSLLLVLLVQGATSDLKLAAVEAQGGKRYAPQEVARLSGLEIGQPIAIPDIKIAAQRLAATGLFKTLSYSSRIKGNQVTVVFEFEEAAWTVPVVFENFVWFSDREILEAVRADVPSFDGTSPALAGATEAITRSLEGLLARRKIAGRVEFRPRTEIDSPRLDYTFRVVPGPPVCAFRVRGAQAIPERELTAAVPSLVGNDYLRSYVTAVAENTLRDLYRRRGHWAAEFGDPEVAVDSAGCSGVAVTLTVAEGGVYTWNGAEWSGHTAVSRADLDAALGIKTGEVADAARIEAGLRQVNALYSRHGYLTQKGALSPRLDADTRRAVFEIRVSEGPQFRMGDVGFSGISDAQAAALRNRWKLRPGDVYDEAYAQTFVREEVRRVVGGPLGVRLPSVQIRLEPDAALAHVTLVFR